MKTFYVLFNGKTYLSDTKFVPFGLEKAYFWHENMGNAHRFESLCQAHEFIDSSGLQLEILRIDITSVWTPSL